MNMVMQQCGVNKDNLWFDAFLIEDHRAWLFSQNLNGLFEVDLLTLKVSFLGSVPNERTYGSNLYNTLVKVDNEIVLVPSGAKEIAIYHTEEHTFTKIPFDVSKVCKEEIVGIQFFAAAVHKNYVYMIGMALPLILKLDLQTKQINYLTEWADKVHQYQVSSQKIYFRNDYAVVKENLYLASCNSNLLIKINMNTDEPTYYRIGDGNKAFRNICYDGKNFWISIWGEAALIQWNEVTGEYKIYSCPMDLERPYYTSAILDMGDLWIYPITDGPVLRFDKEEKVWEELKIYEPFRNKGSKGVHPLGQNFPVSVAEDKTIYTLSGLHLELLQYNLEKQEMKASKLIIDPIVKKRIAELHSNHGILSETEQFHLDDLIQAIGENDEKLDEHKEQMINENGKRIYQAIKKLLK